MNETKNNISPIITSVRFYGKPKNNFICYASVNFDSNFVINGIKIIKRGDCDLILGMPSRQNIEGEFEDLAHPLNSDYRTYLEYMVLTEYTKQRL